MMRRHLLYLGFFLILAIAADTPPTQAQQTVSEEDAQEVLSAMAEADMAQEVTQKLHKQRSGGKKGGQWDARISLSELRDTDILNRLKIEASIFSARGRWQKTREGIIRQAFTVALNAGNLKIQAGGVGMSAGYGLLISSPGRSGGLAAGQALQPQSSRLKGWATTAEKRSALGVGFSWAPNGWLIMAMHGRQDHADDGTQISALSVEKRQGPFNFGTAVMTMADQQGLSLNGGWSDGVRKLGFEWVLWGRNGQGPRQGVWLVSLNTPLRWGWNLAAQWAAANGSAGPLSGARPWALDAWGGAGWALRLTTQSLNSWRLKILLSESRGHDWVGAHQTLSKKFLDVLVIGRPWPQWELSLRWHQRIRSWEAWSETFPWLPPALVKEDERMGLTLDWKFQKSRHTWVFSLRSLGRQGATTNGRRTLFSLRHRRSLGHKLSILLSFQTAWGAAVDLVTAANPIRGVLLPRHWGHWSSEILAGVEFQLWATKLMAAVSRREPAAGESRSAEVNFWAGARANW